MKSLSQRFNGNSQEVVKYARQFGVFPTMQEYQIKTYSSMADFLEDKAPGEKFELTKIEVDDFSQPDAFDKFLEAVARKLSAMEGQLATKDLRIAELERQVNYYKGRRWSELRPKVESVLSYCEK